MNSILKFSSILLLFTVLIFTSCKKEIDIIDIDPGDVDPTHEIDQNSLLTRNVNVGSVEGLGFPCFTVDFPFSLIDEDDNIHIITSLNDFESQLADTSIYIVDFVYPLNLTLEDGTSTTAADGEELGDLFAACLPNGWTSDLFPAYNISSENSCFSLQFPITLQRENGTTVVATTEANFVELLASEVLFFTFPINLLDENQAVSTANTVDELLFTLFSCNDWGGGTIDTSFWSQGPEYLGCYELVFPFTVTLSSGGIQVITNHQEYCDLLLLGNFTGFQYPLTLIDTDGQSIIVNSDSELEVLLNDCEYGGPIAGDLFVLLIGTQAMDSLGTHCFDIIFPMSVTATADGVSSTRNFNNQADLDLFLIEFLNFPVGGIANINYPISILYTANNEVATLNNEADLVAAIQDCQ